MYRDFTHPASHVQRIRYRTSTMSASSRSWSLRQFIGRSLIEAGRWLEGGHATARRPAVDGTV